MQSVRWDVGFKPKGRNSTIHRELFEAIQAGGYILHILKGSGFQSLLHMYIDAAAPCELVISIVLCKVCESQVILIVMQFLRVGCSHPPRSGEHTANKDITT